MNKYLDIFDDNSSIGDEELLHSDDNDSIEEASSFEEQEVERSSNHASLLALTEENLASFNKLYQAEAEEYDSSLLGNEGLNKPDF